jgi:hypothetical protein
MELEAKHAELVADDTEAPNVVELHSNLATLCREKIGRLEELNANTQELAAARNIITGLVDKISLTRQNKERL